MTCPAVVLNVFIFIVVLVYIIYNIYTPRPDLVKERDKLKNIVVSLGPSPFDFGKLIAVIKERQKEIEKVRIKGCLEITKDVDRLISTIPIKSR